MAVGGDDDTLASSLPTSTLDGGSTGTDATEIVNGRYRIVRWLGGGGMGRVYEALDTELGERIALKVLRGGLSDDALERFRREVKLTRRIQHRNVARMFDIGEHKGEKYLTMELVDGDPLSRSIGDKPMPWPQLKAIAEQICAGLAAAHAAGVIHRDLKPDNVLLERGTERAVLTDFGIARGGDDPGVTQIGALIGTPRYMAPEQLACGELDARADLFALGVMLFELATGLRPWSGDNAISIAVSQATTSPRTIDTSSGAIPAFFASLVAACLQMDPKDRPASAADIATAIATGTAPTLHREQSTRAAAKPTRPPELPRRPTPVPAVPTLAEPTSLAVLPIACAPADEYLADGVLDDVTDTLSTTPGLRVRPAGIVRSTSAPDPRELGQRLQVDHVVTSTLRRTAAGLRITTRLISVADGFQIWAHKTDCAEADVLAVADDLARGIATALSTRATSVTKLTDPRAVDCYLRARAELRRFWGSHAVTAAGLLEQAVDFAPTSAPILGAFAYASVQAWVMRGERELLPRAQSALARGLASGHGEAYLASAQYHFNHGELEDAGADLGRALIRAPMSAQTHELAGKILVEIEGVTPARQHYETARGLDPSRTPIIDTDLARLDALESKWEDADARIARIRADPDPSLAQLGFILNARLSVWRGRRDVFSNPEAISRIASGAAPLFGAIASIQRDGKVDVAQFQRVVTQPADPDRPRRQMIARLQIVTEMAILLDEPDLAFTSLERAVELGLMDVAWMDSCPLLAGIASDRRFSQPRRQVGERAASILAAFRSVTANS